MVRHIDEKWPNAIKHLIQKNIKKKRTAHSCLVADLLFCTGWSKMLHASSEDINTN